LPVRRHLKDREAKQLLKDFTQQYPSAEKYLAHAKEVEEEAVDEDHVFFIGGRPLILRTKVGFLPTLRFDEIVNSLPRVVVDMGAVAHLANGAHVMRPGIKEVKGEFTKGDLLLIVDEKFGKGIALGQAEVDSSAMRSASKGKVIANLHYVGDELWRSFTAKAE
jgi:PUA domain protein